AEAAGLPLDDTERALKMCHQPISLDQPVRDKDESARKEWLRDYREGDTLAEIDLKSLKTRIAELLEVLSWREREIIKLRYGL
ncbi:MAG: RNA polymerase subunit sigma-70, partial [Planctomycetales bacterium]|nr:RNA polymerase subunit sigma-70 [Planctomycetales bacterium]